ncbi:MAG: ATP-binding protein, partial [Patescibacteria group bacterium]
GSLYEVGVAVSPILNELGEVAWFIMREHDLSETKNRTLILQQILDNMPVGICLIEMPSTRVLLSNNYALSLFRRAGIEHIEQFGDIVPLLRLSTGEVYPEEKLPHTEAMRTREVVEMDDIQVWKQGGKQREMIWKVHGTPIFNAKGELMQILLAVDDVTQTKELEHKMTDSISVAAHQLRTPLTGIKWAIDEYRKSEEGGVSKEDRKTLFDTLYEATVRMFNVIQGLLDVSKLEQGKVEVKPEPVHLDTFIDNALKDFAHPVTEKKLSIKQAVLHTLPEASYDVILLRQVIQNLIDNAIKYTPVGGEIASILSLEKEHIHWTLHDSGIGITKADLEHLFEKFHRGDNAQRLDAYGMGLGLYAVKSIMDLLGGEIRCESEEGHGTTFHLFFPLKRA